MENFTHLYTSLLDVIFTLPRSEYLQFMSTESSRSFTSTVFGRNGSENSLTSLDGNRTKVFWGRVANISTPMSTSQDVTTQQIIGNDIRDVIIIVNMAVLCQIVSVAGVIVNVFNVCVFVKQGFRDALNVTLASLALADLGIVVFAVWLCVCYNPLFSKLDLPFKPMEFVYLTAGLPRLSCARVSSWILAIASLERCLCITMPLTFKSIITPGRSFAY
ncbi:adenosine receptor A1 [Biomphalaria pfeifferi]|uniref:Adenosine receptor A1 n=1 Tax=Biomphalaria pfeifferi TaxID=112525 RepID=A0AAD8AVJ0_BIOPF|nr:adenosine receptor A1 [Biomphalaria pfeifferi]